jgi:pimeloyl-ACP methyl ester carboxylesterase
MAIRVLVFIVSLLAAIPTFAGDEFFNSAGVQIHYVDEGKGQPIVLVHGALGNIESNWIQTGVITNLSRDHRVIALDMRGHGRSGKPYEPAAYGHHMADDIVRLLDHLKIRKAHLIGYSFGAVVAGYTSTRFPDRFLTVTFGGATPMLAWTAAQQKQFEERAQQYEQGSVRGLILRTAAGVGEKLTEAQIQKRESELLQTQDLRAIAAVSRSQSEFLVKAEELKTSTVPTLAIVGSDDPALNAVNELRRLRPDIGLVIIDGATHAAPRNARQRPEFSDAVRQFVARHAAN